MSSKIIGIIAHEEKPGAAGLITRLASSLESQGLNVAVESKAAAIAQLPDGGSVGALSERCDLLLVLGGDGTMLRVVHRMTRRSCPVLGINHGSLGFLTCLNSDDLDLAVEAVVEESFTISPRSLLKVTVRNNGTVIEERTGLNDAVLSRGEISRLVQIEVRIDGMTLTRYNADGLIVATPTGTTAYSLSAGGPISMPDASVFVITPICPHVLTNRAVAVSDGAVITLSPDQGESPLVLAVDGQQIIRVDPSWQVEICKAPELLQLAMMEGTSFADVLQHKLRWSGTNLGRS